MSHAPCSKGDLYRYETELYLGVLGVLALMRYAWSAKCDIPQKLVSRNTWAKEHIKAYYRNQSIAQAQYGQVRKLDHSYMAFHFT